MRYFANNTLNVYNFGRILRDFVLNSGCIKQNDVNQRVDNVNLDTDVNQGTINYRCSLWSIYYLCILKIFFFSPCQCLLQITPVVNYSSNDSNGSSFAPGIIRFQNMRAL